jgi:DNA-binding response OmpR family regulator
MDTPHPQSTATVVEASAAAIVILEDNPHDVFFVRRALERAHIANPIVAFASATQARSYLGDARSMARPAIVILDVALAGGETGLAFLRWLRAKPLPLGTVPAMMLTASASAADRDEAEMLGSIYFLHKPVTAATLTAAVESLGCAITNRSGVLTLGATDAE